MIIVKIFLMLILAGLLVGLTGPRHDGVFHNNDRLICAIRDVWYFSISAQHMDDCIKLFM